VQELSENVPLCGAIAWVMTRDRAFVNTVKFRTVFAIDALLASEHTKKKFEDCVEAERVLCAKLSTMRVMGKPSVCHGVPGAWIFPRVEALRYLSASELQAIRVEEDRDGKPFFVVNLGSRERLPSGQCDQSGS
jgi:hypothetical protein